MLATLEPYADSAYYHHATLAYFAISAFVANRAIAQLLKHPDCEFGL